VSTEPFADRDSCAAIDDAAAALSADRADEWAGDISVELHILASLRLQLDEHLRAAVDAARHAAYGWQDVAELLGITADQARSRYNTSPSAKPRPAHRPRTWRQP
jgi:hypothetical protein